MKTTVSVLTLSLKLAIVFVVNQLGLWFLFIAGPSKKITATRKAPRFVDFALAVRGGFLLSSLTHKRGKSKGSLPFFAICESQKLLLLSQQIDSYYKNLEIKSLQVLRRKLGMTKIGFFYFFLTIRSATCSYM